MRNLTSTLVKFSKLSIIQTTICRSPPPPLMLLTLPTLQTKISSPSSFKVSPKHFAQLWIIRGFIKGICFPHAYCLLEDKHNSTVYIQPLSSRDLHLCPSLLPHTSFICAITQNCQLIFQFFAFDRYSY